ncbi:MAG: hypothetical protein WA666_07610 [Nitrospirota bacterium]
MNNDEKALRITSQLIARKFLPKKELREMLMDEDLLSQVEDRLGAVGLELATHVYADFVSVKVKKDREQDVFGTDKDYQASNGLSRGALALLAVIWAKIILPKRQMQIERQTPGDSGQDMLWKERKPIPMGDGLVRLEEKALLADFGDKLGGKTRFGRCLNELSRADFVVKKDGLVLEGPLLDSAIDYSVLAPRIIEGALGELLGMGMSETDEDVEQEISRGEGLDEGLDEERKDV